ncbi:hypothetical protein C8R47DRAFT_1289858 [Mycena vitilis]|nr:hypothetical protein C8R47DRAFT_1289858 [Mycena vitilis]
MSAVGWLIRDPDLLASTFKQLAISQNPPTESEVAALARPIFAREDDALLPLLDLVRRDRPPLRSFALLHTVLVPTPTLVALLSDTPTVDMLSRTPHGVDPGVATVGKVGHKRTKGKAHENNSDRVTPKWLAGHELGPILQADQSNNMCGISYNIEPTEFDWDGMPVEFPLEVQFSIGINVTAHKNGRNIKSDKLPTKVAFRVLHQTMLWIRNNDLKTKGVGMVVLSSQTIPDIQTMAAFGTAEYRVLNLERISESAANVSLAGPHNSQEPSIFLAAGVEPIITPDPV